jgi:NAD(P)-dependent dehydrogenase (short-subunit alcohol dehydrogenase family)
MFSIKDKVIVVTGGNGLLGKQMVSTFRKNQAITISVDKKFDQQGQDDFIMDITDQVSVKAVVNSILNKYNKIDGWVNNAYPRTIDWGNKFENILLESWRKNVDMHLNGYFLCCQMVLEQMKKQGFGSLINMSSIYGIVGPDFSVYEDTEMTMPVEYAAAKSGIVHMTKYFSQYYKKFKVRANAIAPGGILAGQPSDFVGRYNAQCGAKGMLDPEDITGTLLYLLSSSSRHVTGQTIVVDDGWSGG